MQLRIAKLKKRNISQLHAILTDISASASDETVVVKSLRLPEVRSALLVGADPGPHTVRYKRETPPPPPPRRITLKYEDNAT